MAQPQKGIAYEFYLSLTEVNDPVFFITNPTIATGDFKVSVDGGALANLSTLPVVTPASSSVVKINLSSIEMGGDKIVVVGKDLAGEEWGDIMAFLDVETGTLQTVLDILEGDHIETSIRLIINKKDTVTPVLDKKIAGSLLQPDVTVTTVEQP